MLSLITLELVNTTSSSDWKNKFKKKKQAVKVEQKLTDIQYERIENFCILIPPAVTLLGIILMSILYKIFM